MAIEEGILIKIGAQVDNATNGIKKVTKDLATIEPAAGKAATALNKIPAGSNQATQALTNLSRVAQDAPYGFMGIANNINPLLESFQRLKAETGSTSGALKALGSSLMSGAGVGLAVGVVSSLLVTFGDKLFSTKKATDELKKSQDEFNKSLKDAEAGAIATGAKLQSFVDIARNGNLPLAQRNQALKEANKVMGEHGEKLTLVNINTQAVTDQVNKFTQALVQQALAARFADRVADLIIKQKDAAQDYGKALKEYNDQVEFTKKLGNNSGGGAGGLGTSGNVSAGVQLSQKLDDLRDKTSAYRTVADQLIDTVSFLNDAQSKSVGLFAEVGTKSKDNTKETERQAKAAAKAADEQRKFNEKLERTLAIMNKLGGMEEIGPPPNARPYTPASAGLTGTTTGILGNTGLKDYEKNIQPFNYAAIDQAGDKRMEDAKNKINSLIQLGQTLQGTFEEVFTSMITGGGNALKSLGKFIQQIITKLVAAAATAAILAALTGGLGAGGKGPGFSSIFKQLAGIPKFATGGITNGPTLAMVGDNPSGRELIIPSEKWGELFGNRNNTDGGGTLEARISGDDLVMILNKANSRRGRSYGG